jgi:hypothetical protein
MFPDDTCKSAFLKYLVILGGKVPGNIDTVIDYDQRSN